MHARTHAHVHTHTHARTHARTHAPQQNSMDMQRSGSEVVFEEHISSSRKLAISGTSATVAHSEGKEITVIYRNRGKLWTVP